MCVFLINLAVPAGAAGIWWQNLCLFFSRVPLLSSHLPPKSSMLCTQDKLSKNAIF